MNKRIALVGPCGAGKTCLMMRFHRGMFRENVESTIGASFIEKEIYVDNQSVKLNIWDTAGQERYQGLLPMYIRNTAVVIICIKGSEFKQIEKYYDTVRQNTDSKICIAITQNDISKYEKIPTYILDYAESINAKVWLTSSKNGENVYELFNYIGKYILSIKREDYFGNVVLHKQKENRKCCY